MAKTSKSPELVGSRTVTRTYEAAGGEARTYSVRVHGLRKGEAGRVVAPGKPRVADAALTVAPKGPRRLGLGARGKAQG